MATFGRSYQIIDDLIGGRPSLGQRERKTVSQRQRIDRRRDRPVRKAFEEISSVTLGALQEIANTGHQF